ncbi:4662_t:CDS:2, partial [Cetraspora pellucida]
MTGWLDPKDWTLKERLLAYRFQLKQKLFTATTDNGVKVVKAIRLIEILHVPCSVHTLHLSVSKGLNAAKAFKKHVTNLILHFNGSPKQTESLKDAQSLPEDNDDEYYINLLNDKLDEVASQDEDTDDEVTTNCPKETTLLSALLDPRYKKLKFATEAQRNMAINKLNELYRIEQAAIIEESNDDLYVSSSELLVTNELLSTSTNQVNYSLLRIYEDSDDESSISNEVARYLALPKVSLNHNVLEWWKGHVNVLP